MWELIKSEIHKSRTVHLLVLKEFVNQTQSPFALCPRTKNPRHRLSSRLDPRDRSDLLEKRKWCNVITAWD